MDGSNSLELNKDFKGTIQSYKTGDGSERFRALANLDGKKRSVGTFRSRDAAIEALRGFEKTKGEHKGVVTQGKMTLREWAREWLQRREEAGHHRCVGNSRLIFDTRIDNQPIAQLPLEAISQKDVKAWLRTTAGRKTYKGTKPRRQTVVNEFNTLRGMLRDAVDEGLLDTNPAREIIVPKEPRTDDTWTVLTLDEVKRVLAAECLSDIDRNCLQFAAFTGCRAGEIFGLRWVDVDLDKKVCSIRFSFDGPTKSGKVRKVPLLQPAIEALQRQKSRGSNSRFVFPTLAGKMRRKGARTELRKACKEVGITRNVRLHDLRHSFASFLVSGQLGRAFSLPEVQFLLGHSSPSTSARYAHMAVDSVTNVVHGLAFGLNAEGDPQRSHSHTA